METLTNLDGLLKDQYESRRRFKSDKSQMDRKKRDKRGFAKLSVQERRKS